MSEKQWHYTVGGDRQGPIGEAELRASLQNGRIPADAHVWTDGLAQWIPAAQLVATRPTTTASYPAAGPEMSYYNPSGGMPPRAAESLRGHARPRGDTGDWPLDDARIAHFEATLKLRKTITRAAQLYRTLLLFSIIGAVVMVIGGVAALSSAGRGFAAGMPVAVVGGVTAGFAVLYGFAWKATLKSHRWAPLTMFIIYLILILVQIGSMALAATTSRNGGAEAVGPFVSLLFCVAFAVISWRSFAAIPKYLSCPAWCQEVLVKAGL